MRKMIASNAEDVEYLAKALHEAGREAVAKRQVVRVDAVVRDFIEWENLDENAREGRRSLARYMLDSHLWEFRVAEFS